MMKSNESKENRILSSLTKANRSTSGSVAVCRKVDDEVFLLSGGTTLIFEAEELAR